MSTLQALLMFLSLLASAPLTLAVSIQDPEPPVAVGPDCELGMEQLDELLIWRHGQAPSGQSALRALLDLSALEQLAKARGVVVDQAELNERWAELEREVVAAGEARDLAEFLRKNHVDRATFSRYLRLGIAHERMVRADLEVPEGTKVPGETQKVWLEEKMQGLGYEPLLFPWESGVVARIGSAEVTRAQLAEELRSKLPDEDLADAAYELLLEQRLLARMPDLAQEPLDAAVEAEVQRRRASVASDPRYKGAGYEQLLSAQGLTIEAVRRDPAVRAAALSHLWVDRTHDDKALRSVYDAERPYFDGQFGAGVLVYVSLLYAGNSDNPLIKRSYEEAEAELEKLKEGVDSVEAFQERLVPISDDKGTKTAKGLLGLITRERAGVPEPILREVFKVLDSEGGDVNGRVLGPVRLSSGVVLICLGQRRAAPTWKEMAHKVHTELRRRHLAEVLPRRRVTTLFDPR